MNISERRDHRSEMNRSHDDGRDRAVYCVFPVTVTVTMEMSEWVVQRCQPAATQSSVMMYGVSPQERQAAIVFKTARCADPTLLRSLPCRTTDDKCAACSSRFCWSLELSSGGNHLVLSRIWQIFHERLVLVGLAYDTNTRNTYDILTCIV